MLGTAQAELLRQQPQLLDRVRRSLLEGTAQRRTPSSKLTERWDIAPSHGGIEHAQLAVVNPTASGRAAIALASEAVIA